MKTQISSAIFFALSFTTSCQAFALKPDQAELDRRSETEGIKYRTYKYVNEVQNYDLPQYLNNNCVPHTAPIAGLVIDEIPASSEGQVGCGQWWGNLDCTADAVKAFNLPLFVEHVSDVVFDHDFKDNAKSFKFTATPCPVFADHN